MRLSLFTVADHHPAHERSAAQLYAEIAAQCRLADGLGFDSFFVAEHHFHEYGCIPNPAVFLAMLAAQTSKIKLGPAISVLPFRNPLQVAEDYALLHTLSEGRAVLGVGSGYLQHEFEGFGIAAEEKRARFDEGLQVLEKALCGERFSFEGKYSSVKDVCINVPPYSRQEIPLYVAVLRREAAYHVGKKGQRIICVPYASVDAFEEAAALVEDYRRGWRESGKEGKGEVLLAFHAHAAESDAQARRNAEAAFNLYADTRLYAKKQSYDDILKSGLGLFGSLETVGKKLQALKAMDIDHLLLLMNFGMMKHETVQESMKLFSNAYLRSANSSA